MDRDFGRALPRLEDGRLVTGSGCFTDNVLRYALLRTEMVLPFSVELTEYPTAGNPLAVKGGGEDGITPALAAVTNAVVDALRPFGVEHIDPPLTAERIWLAMQGSPVSGVTKADSVQRAS